MPMVTRLFTKVRCALAGYGSATAEGLQFVFGVQLQLLVPWYLTHGAAVLVAAPLPNRMLLKITVDAFF